LASSLTLKSWRSSAISRARAMSASSNSGSPSSMVGRIQRCSIQLRSRSPPRESSSSTSLNRRIGTLLACSVHHRGERGSNARENREVPCRSQRAERLSASQSDHRALRRLVDNSLALAVHQSAAVDARRNRELQRLAVELGQATHI